MTRSLRPPPPTATDLHAQAVALARSHLRHFLLTGLAALARDAAEAATMPLPAGVQAELAATARDLRSRLDTLTTLMDRTQ